MSTRNGYAGKVLSGECEAVGATADGGRNIRLNLAALRVGHYVPHELDEDLARDSLFAAAEKCGLDRGEALPTISSGLRSGMREPKQPPKRDRAAPTAPASSGNGRADKVFVESYRYADAGGKVLYGKDRYAIPGDKTFSLWKPDGKGGYIHKDVLKSITRVPYNLAGMLASPRADVVLCEGEKACNAGASIGLVTTCDVCGANSFDAALLPHFADRNVIILPDNDAKGREHAERVGKALYGVAASIRMLKLPNLPEKGDLFDWVTSGGTAESFKRLAAGCRGWKPTPVATGNAAQLLEKDIPPVVWIVPGFIPAGLSILAGRPKVGKSWLGWQMALSVATGGRVLGRDVEPGRVLYLALEDSERRLQDRLRVLGAGPDAAAMEYRVAPFPHLTDGGLEELGVWCEMNVDGRLIIIDTLGRVRAPRRGNSDVYQEDVSAMNGLQALANKHNVAVLLVHHLRKSVADDPLERVSGSIGITGSCDTVLVLDRPRDCDDGTLIVIGRDVAERRLAVHFEGERGQWTVVGDAGDFAMSCTRRLVLDALRDGETKPRDIAMVTGIPQNSVHQMLFQMHRAGEILKVARGQYSVSPIYTYKDHKDDI